MKFLAILLAVTSLAGCAGGGGSSHIPVNGGLSYTTSTSTPTYTASVYPSGWTTDATTVKAPSVSAKITTYKDGSSVTVEDGLSGTPFLQTTLSGLSIADPNSYVMSSTTSYDLRWGLPDPNGPGFATIFSPAKITLDSPVFYMGKTVTSYTNLADGPTFYTPTQVVKAAWSSGWTGKGVNILSVDSYAGTGMDFHHGVTTMMITSLVAIGANRYGLDFGWNSTTLTPTGNVKDGVSGADILSTTHMGVVNASIGFSYSGSGLNPSLSSDVATAFDVVAANGAGTTWKNVFSGRTAVSYLSVSDAVIVKSAGNDATSSANEPLVHAFATDTGISSRLLIVGATTSDGTTLSKTSLASYSNVAGNVSNISDRFLVANGRSPYDTGDLAIDGYGAAAGSGTSYAAPRVAGYAALLRQKFPNLNASKSASILLDTARYDTLSCYPNCNPSIYGRGGASISRALAPVGSLR